MDLNVIFAGLKKNLVKNQTAEYVFHLSILVWNWISLQGHNYVSQNLHLNGRGPASCHPWPLALSDCYECMIHHLWRGQSGLNFKFWVANSNTNTLRGQLTGWFNPWLTREADYETHGLIVPHRPHPISVPSKLLHSQPS